MLYMFPVYDISIAVSKSTHQALLAPGPTPIANHESIEIHTVELVPGPWAVRSKRVFGDGFRIVLEGHDTGMLVPHIPNIPALDFMLPLTMLSSSCTWPFVTGSRSADGKCFVGFLPVLAPFIHCDSPQPGGTSSTPPSPAEQKIRARFAKAKAAVAERGAKVTKQIEDKIAGSRVGKSISVALDRRIEVRPASEGVEAVLGRTYGEELANLGTGLADICKEALRVDGKGFIYIPPAKTVIMRVSFSDFLEGWMRIAVAQVVKGFVSKLFSPLSEGDVSLFSRRVTERVAWQEIKEHAVHAVASTTLVDGLVKSLIMDAKIKAPFGVYSYSFSEGKGSYLFWGEFEGKTWTFDFKGLGHVPSQWFQTKPIDTLTQTPNVAGA